MNQNTIQANSSARSSDAARVLTAAIGIPLVLLVVWLGGVLFALVVTILALLALRELELACQRFGTPLVSGIAYPALLINLWCAWIAAHNGDRAPDQGSAWPFMVSIILTALLIYAVLNYGKEKRVTLMSVALTVLAVAYTSLFAFLILLREFPVGELRLFLTVLLGVWTGDTAAYFVGRKWGKTPLTILSPKKTVEGTMGGVLLAFLLCLVSVHSFGFGWGHAILIGLLIAVMSHFGDAAESFWKRELGVKDLGALLPGHGGVLDRCDSLLFATFAVYLYALWQL